MDEERRTLCHKLKNAEQENLALKGLVERAADEIDDLLEADCSEEAIGKARALAKRLKKAGASDLNK